MKKRNEQTETIENLLEDALRVYDDAERRLSLTQDAREREDWKQLIKEAGDTIQLILSELPENQIKIRLEGLAQ